MRQVRRQRVIVGAVLGALPLLLSTGCSFSIGGPGAVDAELVAERSSEMLAQEGEQIPGELTCSEDLPAEVGAEIRCEFTHDGESLGVTVTTTSVEDSDVEWDVQVDRIVEAEWVAERSSEMLAEEIGQTPDEFTCSEDLPAEVGAEIRCELTHGGESLGVTVTTTSVEGSDVEWDVQVDDAPL